MDFGLTASNIIATATTWAAGVGTPVLLVIGFGVMLTIAGWVVSLFRRR